MSIKNILKNKNLKIIMVSIIIFLLVFVIFSKYLYILDKKIQDVKYKVLNKQESEKNQSILKNNKNIIIIKIDDISLEKLGRFPFDRKKYIPIIKNLTDAGAAVIGFDIIFQDKTNNISDNAFNKAIKDSGRVVIGVGKKNQNIKMPIDILKKSVAGIGSFSPVINGLNKNVYSIEPFIEDKRFGYIDNFAIKLYKVFYSNIYNKNYTNYKSSFQGNKLNLIPGKQIPLLEKRYDRYKEKNVNDLLITYVNYSDFKSYSFYQLYYEDQFNQINKNNVFKDKIVIIGATSDGIKDIFFTPLEGSIFGVYIHANVLNTILNNYYIGYFNKNIEKIIIFLLIIISVFFNYHVKGKILFFSNISIFAIFIIYSGILIYLTPIINNYIIELVFALFLSILLTNIDKYGIENKQKGKLNKALGEYVSKDIASEILSESGKINLDGENKRVAIFFSDIEGFTSVSEKFSPEKLVGFLREYLTDMSNIIMDEKGFINKYEGDAIMALWGVFGKSEEKQDSYNACLSALKQQISLIELNKTWKERGFSEIKARIGIHIGNSIIGNIGAEGRKMEFTALGDSVNLASRLEGVNKFYGTYICVSEDIYIETKKDFEYRFLDKITVKGKSKAIKIYELICKASDITNEIIGNINKFQIAVDLYLEKDFFLALSRFEALAKAGDKPSITYIERCKKYIKTPPEDNWSGVWNMTEK